MRWGKWSICICWMIVLAACISLGPKRRADTLHFRDGVVHTGSGYQYSVGTLSPEWSPRSVSSTTVVFYHATTGASIATDAYCGKNQLDMPNDLLVNQLLSGVEHRQTLQKMEPFLDHRGARRLVASGKTDGVAMTYDVVVVKKDACVIDFMLVSPPATYHEAVGSFEHFFGDFHM